MVHPVFIGCDVSKAHLDLFDAQTQKHIRIDNTPVSIAGWLATLEGRDVTVVLEATGRYDRLLCVALEEAQRPYCRVNPARARDFAKALGLLAKTDAIDARLLAHMGQTLSPPVNVPPDPLHRHLADLHGRRDQLVAMRQQERVRIHNADQSQHASIESHIAWLDDEIARIEKACHEHVRADQDMSERNKRLRSIPGIGPVTAFTLLAHMPELGGRSPKAMAALAGLAPFNADSGTLRGQRHIRGGRKRVRDALYMAALVAYRMKSPFARTAQTMMAKGKPLKVIFIAIARKILVTANALLRDKTMFQTT
ncbi:IS110 family transposase [Rhizobium sp. Pop5]|uniref:IS110 family transposase n=1 Tax=Rhizobium sp. Pop5 TaxID=1223565 RepID=UPI0002839035|nr:IS110 family transposase [Rhizobium sp. Pop5]EJZ16686.1 transposase IS116/IS110/IS902 family protein [Rhizobium sp. Pop5]UVD55087.1 IS110 family transposase [Rhizobium sp. Pop5]UVD58900.1 IS110 family transposase [Rhizobium sp. Pop5]